MEPNQKSLSNVQDFFLNLGATISLYVVVGSLINLLFTIINTAYPRVTNTYQYFGSVSISWPVAVLIIFFPIFILLMWLIAKDYSVNPERRSMGIHKWLTYLTLFLAGGLLAGDLITVVYYFIDGQELTTGFLLKVLVLLVISSGIFTYYLSEVRGKLTTQNRMYWRIFATLIIIGSIVWGFSVLGSPRNQRLVKYDQQKISDLSSIKSAVESYYSVNASIPNDLDLLNMSYYYFNKIDPQTGKEYEYIKTSNEAYSLCAEFNKTSDKNSNLGQGEYYYDMYTGGNINWDHQNGRSCFDFKINPNFVL